MIFNEIKYHVNTSLGLVGGYIPCIPPLCPRLLVFPARVFPKPIPVFLAIFSCPKSVFFFNYQTRVFKKTCNCCCIQMLVILITLKSQIDVCNGQTSAFELSTIIMRHEVRALFSDHRTFVVGPFIFSFN